MNRDRIETLLQRFYDAQTTDEEELLLKEYFNSDDVPPWLLADRQLFLLLAEANDAEVKVPSGLADRLNKLIDSQEHSSPRTATLWQWLPAAAASILILFSVGLNLLTPQSTDVEIDDPHLAYELTCQALELFADAMGTGMDQMQQAREATIDLNRTISELLQ